MNFVLLWQNRTLRADFSVVICLHAFENFLYNYLFNDIDSAARRASSSATLFISYLFTSFYAVNSKSFSVTVIVKAFTRPASCSFFPAGRWTAIRFRNSSSNFTLEIIICYLYVSSSTRRCCSSLACSCFSVSRSAWSDGAVSLGFLPSLVRSLSFSI